MQDLSRVSILIVGAGPAGLAAAIAAKHKNPHAEVCVIDKSAQAGFHNLSGAVLETAALAELLDPVAPDWRQSDQAKAVLVDTVQHDNVLFVVGAKWAFDIHLAIDVAAKLKLGFGQLKHAGDAICSVSKLTAWLEQVAVGLGAEVLHGFAAQDILWDEKAHRAIGVKLVDQGLDKEGHKQRNYLEGEVISADIIILAEGCDGLLTEKFIQKADLSRQGNQLYSVGIKELLRVSPAQYEQFSSKRVVHALGWPLWTPVIGPGMFGGGIMYPMGDNRIAVGMIVGLDYQYCDFNPQDALTLFKQHAWVKRFIDGATAVEAGAKMIPEGGWYAIPRCRQTGAIGRANVMLVGDSAGFVNMLKIKGLHNAIRSGIAAGKAAVDTLAAPLDAARLYTRRLEQTPVLAEMRSAKNFRQTVAKFGPLVGMPLSVLGGWLPKFHVEPDYKTMTTAKYRLKPAAKFDKDTFTALAATKHREEEPCHLLIGDPTHCVKVCLPKFGAPCITFCPAGVYENIQGQPKPANPSNCLHCKTCQRKCPYDNIRWTVPEGGGGPRYRTM